MTDFFLKLFDKIPIWVFLPLTLCGCLLLGLAVTFSILGDMQ